MKDDVCCDCGECSARKTCCKCGHCIHGSSYGIVIAAGYSSLYKRFCCPCATCFPAKAKVSIENGQYKTMEELMIGDRVKTGL